MSRDPAQLEAIFESIFGLAPGAPTASGTVAVQLALTAEELRGGVDKTIEIAHPGECTVCEPIECAACEGRGFIEQKQGFFVIQRNCECAGGQRFDRHCPACEGTGTTRDVVEVTVPPDSEAGTVISIANEGDRIDGGERGDLLVHLAVVGVDVPRAAVHRPRQPGRARLAVAALVALALIAVASQLW